MKHPSPLPVWDRAERRMFQEWMGDSVDTYETTPLQSLSQRIRSHPLYADFISVLRDSAFSVPYIKPFIRKHHIKMHEFEPVDYTSYDEFFIRKFKPGMRHFPSDAEDMGAFAEARYMGWEEFDDTQLFPVKGKSLNPSQIFGSEELANPFLGGPLILARLSPVDYHHVHYPDNGRTLERRKLGRRLWTVNWKAMQNKRDICIENEREIQILDTENFGRLGIVEIGALTVGRIVQSHPVEQLFERGEIKSHFRFGGSAVAMFGYPGAWRPCDDLLRYTKRGIETYIRLGDTIAKKLTAASA